MILRGEADRSAARTHSLRSVSKGSSKVLTPVTYFNTIVCNRQLASRLTGGYIFVNSPAMKQVGYPGVGGSNPPPATIKKWR